MYQLQQLHCELDIAQAAGTKLELVCQVLRRDVLGDAFAHLLHAGDKVRPCGA